MTTTTNDDERPLTQAEAQAEVDERAVALLRQITAAVGDCSATWHNVRQWAAEAAALLPELNDRVFVAQDEAAEATLPATECNGRGLHCFHTTCCICGEGRL